MALIRVTGPAGSCDVPAAGVLDARTCRDPLGHAEERAILGPVTDMRTDVMLSMMRALWEQVTGDLRGVATRP
jgi:hypothetical protein